MELFANKVNSKGVVYKAEINLNDVIVYIESINEEETIENFE